MTQPLLQAADLRGAARLTTDAVEGLASLVEAMHARIVTLPRIPQRAQTLRQDDRTRGVTGLVYETVRGVTRLVGGTADALLGWLAPALDTGDARLPPRPEREAILSALNGVLGDHLATTDNPLAIPMQLRHSGRPLPLERRALRAQMQDASPKVVVLLHGLCMNDLQWDRAGHDHGKMLAQALGYTPVYLRYNSGLSVSTNGRILAQLMERLYSAWPMPVERLVMLGHSMGGLVARSAIHHGEQLLRGDLRWPGRVTDLVTLGTPHQGAPLEQAGHGIDVLLSALPYAAPLARLSRARSAGINDLRLGSILRTPADAVDSSETGRVELPHRTRCYAMAASLGPASGSLGARGVGDGLVPVASALGQHRERQLDLGFALERQAVVHGTGHLELLSSAEAGAHLRQWLS